MLTGRDGGVRLQNAGNVAVYVDAGGELLERNLQVADAFGAVQVAREGTNLFGCVVNQVNHGERVLLLCGMRLA